MNSFFSVAVDVFFFGGHFSKSFGGTLRYKNSIVSKTLRSASLMGDKSFANAFKKMRFLFEDQANNRSEARGSSFNIFEGR